MRTLKWGLIGAGDIARKRIAPALRDAPSCDLVAVSRRRAELAESFAREFGAGKWFADWRGLIADEEIEAVYIATPVFLHKEQTIAAAENGKHVLCEKPMAMNVAECDEMIEICRANQVKLGIAYYRRFYPVIERAKQIIAAGDIGKVSVAQINAFEFFDPAADDPRRWLLEKEKSGGGPLMDFGCHRVEVLTNLFGAVESSKSLISNRVFKREVEDVAAAIFQFENGACATLTISHAAREAQDTLHIFGTNGSIHIPILNKGEMRIRIGDAETVEFHPPAPNVHQPLIEDYTEAVLQNREPQVDGEKGRETALVTENIYRLGAQATCLH